MFSCLGIWIEGPGEFQRAVKVREELRAVLNAKDSRDTILDLCLIIKPAIDKPYKQIYRDFFDPSPFQEFFPVQFHP